MNDKATVLNLLLAGQVLSTMRGISLINTAYVKDYVSQWRKAGYIIEKNWITNQNTKERYKIYWMKPENRPQKVLETAGVA